MEIFLVYVDGGYVGYTNTTNEAEEYCNKYEKLHPDAITEYERVKKLDPKMLK